MNTVCPPNAGEMLKSRVRNLCSATDNSNTGTKPAASDNSNTEADRPGAQDETTTASATSGAKQQREQPEKGMNESERRVWKDWDERDEQAARQVGASNGRRPISDSSTLEVAMKKEQHGKLRDQAQNRLKQHVKKAMGILDDTAEDEGSTTVGPQPDSSANYPNEHIGQSSAHDLDDNATKSTTTKSTKSSYPAALSLEQTRMLTVFSAALRNEGVKVLKLNRHLKWQIRYLTVSREPVKIDGGFEKRDGDTQCPKGLLWLKQPNVNMQKHSSEKICGHGGLLFSELSSVDPVKDSIHASRISRKMQKLFPSFEGVSLKYSQEGVTREVLFCLQSEAEAEAFCTAVTIIKEVADRERSRVSVQSGA